MTDDRPLRVLEVAPRYFPDMGGTESHVHEVTTRMTRAADLEVTVLATDRSGRLPEHEVTPDGFEVLRRRAYPRTRDYYFAPGIARVIARGGWDLIHFQGVHTLVPVLGMLAARRAGLPYLLTFHTGGHSSTVRSAIRDTQWRVLTPLLRRAARLVAVSRYERARFVTATGIEASRFVVIRNGGSLPELDRPVSPVPGRVVSSGRLERYKGHHRAIAALPLLRRSDPDAHLVILGSGPYERDLTELATSLGVAAHVSIRQVDPRDRGAMARELASAQAMAALSEYEAHPVGVMEALTLGVPVVGVDVAGIGDLVEEGLVDGVPADASAEAIAAALSVALRRGRGDRVERGGRHSSSSASSTFPTFPTWDACAEQLAEVYREVGAAARR